MGKLLLDGGTKFFKIILLIFIVVSLVAIFLFNYLSKNDKKTNLNDTYTEKIYKKLKNKEAVALSDIFEFDFDEAYVIPELYSTEDYLLKKYELTTIVELKDLVNNYSFRRILFIKNNIVVYDFLFSVNEIFTKQTDVVVFPDTKIINSDNNLKQDACEFFLFEGNVINGIIDRKYTERISKKIIHNSDFLMGDIFDFEFDKAYLVSNIYTREDLLKKYNLKTSVEIKDLTDKQAYMRILFIKNDLVVYDYAYSNNDIYTEQKDVIIFPTTKVVPFTQRYGIFFVEQGVEHVDGSKPLKKSEF